MGSTEQARDRFVPTIILADIQRFAALPNWLARAAQSASVSDMLTRSIQEFAAGEMSLHACKIGGLRLNTTTHTWTGTYAVTVTTAAKPQRQVIPLQGALSPPGQPTPQRGRADIAFGSVGWRWYVPELRLELAMRPPDPELPILPQLTDPDNARALLEHGMHRGKSVYRDVRIQACHPEVLRYHPGLRAAVRYQLTYPADRSAGRDWPAVVIAKTYEGDQGQHAYDGMRALWNAPLASGAAVTIAEPIAYLPTYKVLIQGPVPEDQTLKTLIESTIRTQTPASLAELNAYLHQTAGGLAALHSTKVDADTAYGWADELAEVRASADHLAAAVPELAGAATSLLAMLDAYAAATPPDPPVFAHGTFRPNQVLLHQGQIGLIDFDSWCLAEPALDLALFLTSIKDVGLSAVSKAAQHEAGTPLDTAARLANLARLEAICDRFLEHYTTLMPISRPRVILWEALALFALVLRSWDRVKPVRLENTMLLLDRHIRRHLI